MASNTLEFVLTAVDKASATLDKVGGSAEKASGGFNKIKVAGNVAFAAAGAAAVAFADKSVEAYEDAQASQAKLEDAYNRFPGLADTNIESLRKLDSALQAKTGFDDDATAAAQANLAQYGLTGEQISKLTPLMQDFAAKTGTDVTSASESLGKALLGSGKALKTVGIDFTDTGNVGGNFDEIVSGLTDKVGGFAEVAGDTAAGKTEILKAEFGDLQEQVGGALSPALERLTSVGTEVVEWLNDSGMLMPILIGLLVAAAAAWIVLNAAMLPEIAIGLAIGAAITGIILAIQNWGNIATWFKNLWNNVLAALAHAFATILETIAGILDALGHIPGFGWAKDAADAIGNAADKARAFADGLKDVPKSVTVQVHLASDGSKIRIATTNSGTGVTTPVGTVTAFAKGGIVTSPTLALIGEAGPEAVVPLRDDAALPSAVNVTVNVDASKLRTVADLEQLISNARRLAWQANGVAR